MTNWKKPFRADNGRIRDSDDAEIVDVGEAHAAHAREVAAVLNEGAAFWMVEQYIADKLHYFCAGACGRGHKDSWATDLQWATRFADRDSAFQVLVHLCQNSGRVVEHTWLDNLPKDTGNG